MRNPEKLPEDYTGFAVIGGSGAYDLDLSRIGKECGEFQLDTPFGKGAVIQFFSLAEVGGTIAFMSRHGRDGYRITAPDVNYRANIWALKEIGTTRILSWSGPGAIEERFEPGDYVVPDDLIDLTTRRESSFFRGRGLGFIRQNPVFCPVLRKSLIASLKARAEKYHDGAVYAVTEGPRLETPAEIRMLKRLGAELVGMTLAPEAFLARELEICYQPCCYVANWAEGIKELPFREGELFEGMLEEEFCWRVENAVHNFPEIVRQVARELLPVMDTERMCPCAKAMLRYRRAGLIGSDWHTWIKTPEKGRE